MQQIAKMFATLGFKVDTSGLTQFTALLREARGDTTLLARNAKVLKNNLDTVNKSLVTLNANLTVKKSQSNLSIAYTELKGALEKVDVAFKSIVSNQSSTTKALGKINGAIVRGEDIWKRYADQVQRTKDLLQSTNENMRLLRTNSNVRLKVSEANNRNTTSTRNSNPKPSQFSSKKPTFSFGKSVAGEFFRSMLPSAVAGGGVAAVGYTLKEVIKRGREQQQMERSLQFATKDMAAFKDSLEYVRKEAIRTGSSSATLGKTFATVSGAAEGKLSSKQQKDFFSNMGTYFTSVHAGDYEKSLMYLAIQQMFSIGKIQGQEIGQLTGTGLITRAQLNQAIRETYNLKDNSKIEKMQKDGKLDPSKVLQKLFQNLSDRAKSSGAWASAQESSVFKQGQAVEKFNQLSQKIMEGGLDKALAVLMEQLTKLVDILEDVGTGVKFVIDGWKQLGELLGGNGIVAVALTIISALFLRKAKAIRSVIKAGGGIRKVFGNLAAFFRGGLGKAVLSIGKRFFWWINILGLLWTVGSTLNDKMAGKTTWIDVWSAKIELLGWDMRYWFNDIIIGANNMANTIMSPSNLFKDWKPIKYAGNGTDIMKGVGVLNPAALPPLLRTTPATPYDPTKKAPESISNKLLNKNSGNNLISQMGASAQQSFAVTIPIYIDGQLTETNNRMFFANADALLG